VLSAGALALAIGTAGCGGDDEKASDTTPTGSDSYGTTQGITQVTETEKRDSTVDVPADTGTSPEEQPGGAGDEIPASSQALVTGKGGKLSPRIVRVPPFIAVRLVLESADGGSYSLSDADGKARVSVDKDISSASTKIAGLKTGARLVLKGPQGDVIIEANAEPGP
jgi:hypothetical protein